MLMDRKADFVCCDNPTATKFTIHMLLIMNRASGFLGDRSRENGAGQFKRAADR
jgi:hypothetical protein